MQKEHKIYLDKLRESGKCNMFEAGFYLQNDFGLDRKEARKIMLEYFKSFDNK